MKKWLKKYGSLSGCNPIKGLRFLNRLRRYRHEYKELKKQSQSSQETFSFSEPYPCLFDRNQGGGVISGHYFHQDLLVASRIYQHQPERHIDVGSRIDGFVAHVAAFREIEVVDIRDVNSKTQNIRFIKMNLMEPLPASLVECTNSLSSLHVVEHLGLGRYGGPLDWEGHLKGIQNLTDMVKRDGRLYFSVPIGPQRLEFNAHRIFSVQTLLNLFSDRFIIEEFSYVDDQGDLHIDAALTEEEVRNHFGCNYGCGIFQLRKK